MGSLIIPRSSIQLESLISIIIVILAEKLHCLIAQFDITQLATEYLH